MPIQLSGDGRETLEDALSIFAETAGDDPMRQEREKAAAALWAELSGHPIMAAAVRGDHEGAFEGAIAQLPAREQLELGAELGGRVSRVQELVSEAQAVLSRRSARGAAPARGFLRRQDAEAALGALDALADAAGALVEKLDERVIRRLAEAISLQEPPVRPHEAA